MVNNIAVYLAEQKESEIKVVEGVNVLYALAPLIPLVIFR